MIGPVSKRPASGQTGPEIAFESFGVRVAIQAVSDRQLELIRPMLPPGWEPCASDDVSERFSIEPDQLLRWVLRRDGNRVTRAGVEFDHLLLLLDSQLRTYIALKSPHLVFVHAGVVAVGDRLLV